MKNFNNRLTSLETIEEQASKYTGRTSFVVHSYEEANAIKEKIKAKYGDVQGLKFIIDDVPDDD